MKALFLPVVVYFIQFFNVLVHVIFHYLFCSDFRFKPFKLFISGSGNSILDGNTEPKRTSSSVRGTMEGKKTAK
jgi:hypothetical protein